MAFESVAMLHYSAPPVIGGVEAVIYAHARLLSGAGVRVEVVAGRGDQGSLPDGVGLHLVPTIDTLDAHVLAVSQALQRGQVPGEFTALVDDLSERLERELVPYDRLIVHNVFTKHFNLPLTAALFRLLGRGRLPPCLAWCHDISWSSSSSRSKVFPGYPWDLLRSRAPEVTYVVVSKRQQKALADLLGVDRAQVRVVYNGVAAETLLGLSVEGQALASALNLFESDLILLMPVRVTEAKNIEYAMQVTAALKPHVPGVRLVITGPPDPHSSASMTYFEKLRTLRNELGMRDEVRFVFEAGPNESEGFYIGDRVVGDLYRLADVMFMPSHREGFGMPVLEAGLAGVPVVASNAPAAEEIGGDNVLVLDVAAPAEDAAENILTLIGGNGISALRRLVRRRYTWERIFDLDILPLLEAVGAGS